MNLTGQDKMALQRLLSASQDLSNIAYNLGQQKGDHNARLCKISSDRWDAAYREAKLAIAKLKLPPL